MFIKYCFLVFVNIAFLVNLLSGQTVCINEVMSDNEGVVADGDGAFSDWIELYNSGLTTVNLEDWYLTDNVSDLTKWQFSAVSISPKSHLIVWVARKYPTNINNSLHTNFSLESNGEYLALVMPDGITISNDITLPTIPEDIFYGTFVGFDNDYTNVGNFVTLNSATLGNPNTGPLREMSMERIKLSGV